MATDFHEGVNHAHEASGRWSEVQKNPNSPGAPFLLETLCAIHNPDWLVWWAKLRIWDNPLAKRHIDWYLKGSGMDFNEDAALKLVLENDSGVRAAIARRLPDGQTSGTHTGQFALEQKHYSLDDARTSWGGIDKFDFVADFDAGTLHAWFKDRYEWHPFYPALYPQQSGDFARDTNCLHAAFVEMKLQGAADFWMVGDATTKLKGIPGTKLAGASAPDW